MCGVLLMNPDPLSVTIVSGNPKLEETIFNYLMTTYEDVDVVLAASIHLK